MFQVERQEKIVQILEERPRVTVEELAKQLGVTAMTIRRDLKYLESVQIVSRTFGGAVKRPLFDAGPALRRFFADFFEFQFDGSPLNLLYSGLLFDPIGA